MGIIDIFSKRSKKVNDIYIYDNLNPNFRVQVIHIINDVTGKFRERYNSDEIINCGKYYIFKLVFDVMIREYGKFYLIEKNDKRCSQSSYYYNEVSQFILRSTDVDETLSAIELVFRLIQSCISERATEYLNDHDVEMTPQDAYDELNARFREHGIGYQYENHRIIKFDSTFAHVEITKPVLNLLTNKKFSGANEEYLKAHEYYKKGENKSCLVECLKSFESTLKIICKEKRWDYKTTDTASKLIQICFDNEHVPIYSQNQFTSLKNLLESGIPTIRNKTSGHGQGAKQLSVDDSITRYGLNLTATNILFLIELSGLK